MHAEQRRRILGDKVIAEIHARVAAAPDPPPEVIDALRRILAPAFRRITEERPQDRGSA